MLAVTDEVARFDAPETWEYALSADQEIVADWSEIILEPQLRAYIEEALAQNRSLQASEQSLRRSQAFLRQARSARRPGIDGDVSVTSSGPVEDLELSERYSAGMNVNWEADLWGRIAADIEVAKFDLLAAEALYHSARQSLIAQTILTYVSAIEANQQVVLNRQTVAALEETLRIVQTRYDLGSSPKRDLVLAESDLASARDTLEVSLASARNNIRALQVLTGVYPDGKRDLGLAFPQLEKTVSAGNPADILRRRPDILLAEANIFGSFADLESQEAGRWPRLTLNGDVSSNTNDLSDILDPANLLVSFGMRLFNSLYDGGLTEARLEASAATAQQAVADYGQTVLDAFSDVEGRLDEITVLERRYDFSTTAAEAAKETLRLAEIQYKEGAVDLLDVLNFRQRSLQADRNLISIKRQQIAAQINLYSAVGGALPVRPELSAESET